MLPLNEHSCCRPPSPFRVLLLGEIAQKDLDLLWKALFSPTEKISGVDELKDAYERLQEAYSVWREEDESRGIRNDCMMVMRQFLVEVDLMLRAVGVILSSNDETKVALQEVLVFSSFPDGYSADHTVGFRA